MNILLTRNRAKPDELLYYAPPRYRRASGETGIRPVLERLSRGEPSPSLSPEFIDDAWLAPLPIAVLAPDPFSVVGKVATVAVCVAAIAAGALYLFALGDEPESSPQRVAARTADRLVVEPPQAAREHAAHETAAIAVEPVADQPRQEVAPAKTMEPRADIDLALIAPLKMWGMFPATAGPAVATSAEEDNAAAQSAAASHARPPRRQRRAQRARAAPAQASEAPTAAAQAAATQNAEANPVQTALRKLFGSKQ
jgi:hypothetical protein